MNRREFVSRLTLTGAALAAIPVFEACNPIDVWHEVEQWTPVAISTFESVVDLISPITSPAIDAIAETVKAGFASLSGAIDDYLNAPAADKASLGQRVQLILTELGNNIQSFLTAIGQSSNPVVKVAAAIISIIVNAIAGFLSKIPGPVSLKFRTQLHVGSQTIPVVATVMTRKQFIAAVNEELNASGNSNLTIPHKAPVGK